MNETWRQRDAVMKGVTGSRIQYARAIPTPPDLSTVDVLALVLQGGERRSNQYAQTRVMYAYRTFADVYNSAKAMYGLTPCQVATDVSAFDSDRPRSYVSDFV